MRGVLETIWCESKRRDCKLATSSGLSDRSDSSDADGDALSFWRACFAYAADRDLHASLDLLLLFAAAKAAMFIESGSIIVFCA